MAQKSYLGGLEGSIAKMVSLMINLAFFSIYTISQDGLQVSWFELVGVLLLFWVIYEVLGYILYIFFSFFARTKISRVEENSKEIVNQDK